MDDDSDFTIYYIKQGANVSIHAEHINDAEFLGSITLKREVDSSRIRALPVSLRSFLSLQPWRLLPTLSQRVQNYETIIVKMMTCTRLTPHPDHMLSASTKKLSDFEKVGIA